ncbi:MAG TPA: DUF6677 family protein [Fimbriiglobus sp.]|jgi:hypothetical protein
MPPVVPTSAHPAHPEKRRDFLAAFLSFLLPGLGQVMQGRIAKGVLFFVCLNALFFYGMMMGRWKNVWLPDVSKLPPVEFAIRGTRIVVPDGPLKSISYRPQFLGQMFIGVAAWPAMLQYATFDRNKAEGPLFGTYQRTPPQDVEEAREQGAENVATLNDLQRDGDKRWDLGWVFTVIAGVLNLLVIYDAFAGPVILPEEDEKKTGGPASAPKTGGTPS